VEPHAAAASAIRFDGIAALAQQVEVAKHAAGADAQLARQVADGDARAVP